MHHQQAADVLENSDFIKGPFVSPNGAEWKVLAERIGRRPLKCFEINLEAARINVSPGVVHNTFFKDTKLPLEECEIWLTYKAVFAVATASIGGSSIPYRLPGPQSVEAQIIGLVPGSEPTNENVDPGFLLRARKLGAVTRNGTQWSLTGGTGIYPVAITALGGFLL